MITQRLWGTYEVLAEGPSYKVKKLLVEPGKATSMQSHEYREEWWFFVATGDVVHVPQGKKHKLENDSAEVIEVIEIQCGICNEDDITRY